MGVLFPNSIANLLDGPIRALRAPHGVAPGRPDDISDIISMVHPYTPKTGWIDFGATADAASYDRDMDSEEYTIEQETSAVFSRITGVTRGFTIPISEITPENMQIIEEGAALVDIAAAAGAGAQTKAAFGSIESLTVHRIAFIAIRDPGFGGVVIEPPGDATARRRGLFVALVGYRVTLAAEGSSVEIAKGSLATREVSFTLFPEDGVANADENTGAFLFEEPGTILAA